MLDVLAMYMPLTVHGATHPGLVHETNEDAWSVIRSDEGGLLMVVCDGMGGMGHGDEASALAMRVLVDQVRAGAGYPPDRLRQAIRRADTVVRESLCDQGRGFPGSTAVLAYVLDGMAHVAWVGDSRAYLVRAGIVVERTTDHKLVNELVAAGQLTEAEARASSLAHVVTRALGGRPPGERPVNGAAIGHPWKLERDDVIVLCSDGVSDLVADEELPALVTDADPRDAVDRLVQVALDRGGHDNITCIVARWDGGRFAEDDVATPLMPGPRDGIPELDEPDDLGPRDDPGPRDELGGDDDRPGADRPTEELPRHLAEVATPAPPSARDAPASRGEAPNARSTDEPSAPRSRWPWVAVAVLLLVAFVGLALVGLGGSPAVSPPRTRARRRRRRRRPP